MSERREDRGGGRGRAGGIGVCGARLVFVAGGEGVFRSEMYLSARLR